MRVILQRSRAVPLLLLVLVADCASNRPQAPVMLPAPLVSALIVERVDPTRPAPEYTVGTLPPGYPVTLVPSGPARIVGGMATSDQIIAVFADSTRRLAAVLEQLFVQAGYTRPAESPGSGFMSGSGPYMYFCNDSATVSAEPLTGSNRDFARVTYRRLRRTPCTVTRGRSTRDVPGLELPQLMPPAGVRVGSSHGGSGGDGINSSAEMTGTALVPSTILAHYATQLVAARWTAAAPAISARLAAQYFEARDANGVMWVGVLMAVGGESAITVSLNMKLSTRP